jgi:stage IV sporulation protein FB
MLLSEPPPSQGDLRFRVFGFPVRVHPWFWVVAVILGLDRTKGTPPAELLLAVAVIFVSILVHELGHAFAQRYFGGRPWITLYGLGGLASCDDCDRSPRSQILISLAGPVAGFVAALLLLLLIKITGREAVLLLPGQDLSLSESVPNLVGTEFLGIAVLWEEFPSGAVNFVLRKAFFVNIGWGLINLLPIYPLDGGRVSGELFTLQQPRRGIVMSLQLSMVAAGAMALIGVVLWQSLFTALMFGYLAYSNYQTLQAYRSNRW